MGPDQYVCKNRHLLKNREKIIRFKFLSVDFFKLQENN